MIRNVSLKFTCSTVHMLQVGAMALALIGVFAQPVFADEAAASPQPRGFTTSERNTVLEVLYAYEMRLDPEYYLSGEYLRDVNATSDAERKNRLRQLRLQREREKRLQENAYLHAEVQRRHAIRVAKYQEEQATRYAQWKVQAALHRRHRCAQYQRQKVRLQRQQRLNPNYSYTPPIPPPGC